MFKASPSAFDVKVGIEPGTYAQGFHNYNPSVDLSNAQGVSVVVTAGQNVDLRFETSDSPGSGFATISSNGTIPVAATPGVETTKNVNLDRDYFKRYARIVHTTPVAGNTRVSAHWYIERRDTAK